MYNLLVGKETYIKYKRSVHLMEKLDISNVNEVFEQAVFVKDGTTFEVLQLMNDVDVDELIEEVDSIQELQASIPVIGQYQYIKVTFSKQLRDAIAGWDTSATDVLDVEEFIRYIPSTEEQVEQLTTEQLYTIVSTYLVDMYSYTSFENPNVLEEHVVIKEG